MTSTTTTLASLASGVDFSDVTTAVLTIAGALVAVLVTIKGVRLVMGQMH